MATGNTQQIIDYGTTPNDGTGDPLRTAFIKTDENFDNVWLAGPVGSNVRINNNTVSTINTNGNIIIKPDGVGIIQANASIVPNSTDTRDLGSANLVWRRLYVGTLSAADIAVTGNLTVDGNIIQIGNLITDALTIQLANTATTANAANGAGITVGAYDNTATMLYSSSSNVWNTNIGITAVGNVTAPYFIGNGSLLTGISSTGDYVFANNLMSIANINMEISATGTGADIDIEAADAVFIEALGSEVDIRSAAETFITTGSGTHVWTFDNDGSLDAPGNITANYFIGDGSLLTGITSYANANVVAYGQAGWAGNIIPAANAVYSLGNATNYWSNLWVANNTIYIGGVPLGMAAGNILTVNGADVVTTSDNEANIGNLTIYSATISVKPGAPDTDVYISPSGESWAFLQLPINDTANVTNTRLHNDAGNVEIGAGDASNGNPTYEWVFDNTGTLIFPRSQTSIYGGLDNDFTINTSNANVGTVYTFTFSQFGNLSVPVDLIVGNDLYAADLVGPNGNITVTANTQSWLFDNNGTLTLPGNSQILPAGNTGVRLSAGASDITGLFLNNAGDAELYANANVSIYADSDDTAQGWTFDTTGNLILPAGGDLNFVAGGIAQTVDEDFTILVQDGDDDGFSVYLNVDDGSGTVLSQYQQQRDQFELGFPSTSTYYQFNDNGTMVLPANAGVWTDAYSNVSIIARSVTDTSFVELMSQDNSDIKRSNVTVTRDNVTVTTSSGVYNWTFDVNGDLIVPGGNTEIYVGNAVGNVAGNSISITGGDADQTAYYATPGGNVNISGGLGAFNDGGGGGQGGSVNISSGLSADPAGVPGNVNIDTGDYTWTYGYNGELWVPGGTGYISSSANAITIYSDAAELNGILLYGDGAGNDGIDLYAGQGLTIFANNAGSSRETRFLADGTISVQGMIYPVTGFTVSLGNSTNSFNDLFLTGNVTAGRLQGISTATSTAPQAVTVAGGDNTGADLFTTASGADLTLRGGDSLGSPGGWAYIRGGNGTVDGSIVIGDITTTEVKIGNTAILANVIGNLTVGGSLSATGDITGDVLVSSNQNGIEGGEINLSLPAAANTTLSGNIVVIDSYGDRLRFFEGGGSTRGLYMDLANSPDGVGAAIGYRDIPQVSFTGNATIATTDAGKHYYSTQSSNYTLTIANNASQGFQVGAAISIVNQGTGTITIAQGSGVTLYLAGNATSGNRTLSTFGMATIMKVATDTWFINGTGVA